MLEWWNRFALGAGDWLIGWLLALPSDVVLLSVALASAALLTLVRRWTTDQDLLGRVAADRKRLRELARAARKTRDRDALRRIRLTRSLVAGKAIRAEALPLVVSITPIALLATWCLHRLEFHPPAAGEEIEVTATTPVTAVGDVMHLVPQPGLEAEQWVAAVRPGQGSAAGSPPCGVATWTIRGAARADARRLTFRLKERTLVHEIRIGGRTYGPPLVDHGGHVVTEVAMRPVLLFGLLPGVPALFLPPWLVAYLVVVVPAALAMKRILGVR